MALIDTCTAVTQRTYPSGYGFALAYLTDNPGPDHFKAMQEAAWGAVKRNTKAGGMEGAKFVAAYADGMNRTEAPRGWVWWLVEAAQLVHWDATPGSKAAKVMALWNHPGY